MPPKLEQLKERTKVEQRKYLELALRGCDVEKCLTFIEQAVVQKLGIIVEHSLN